VFIAVANQKGGVGKTTTVLNLGAALALRGYRTLVVDLDLQANLTHCLVEPLGEKESNMCEVILDEVPITDIIVNTETEHLYLAPAGESMANLEINLATMIGREQALRNAFQHPIIRDFDFVIMDNPPYLSLVTINSMVAAQHVLVPVSCEYLPMLGLKWLLKSVDKVRSRLHPGLSILGYLLTMYDRREGITTDVEDILRDEFSDNVFETVIRINTRHKSAPSERKTIFQYEHSRRGRGTEDYGDLSEEVLHRVGKPVKKLKQTRVSASRR
jgi:chromosome partitioning protein